MHSYKQGFKRLTFDTISRLQTFDKQKMVSSKKGLLGSPFKLRLGTRAEVLPLDNLGLNQSSIN